MNMTRRAFFLHPTLVVGDDLENAGEWLRRARRRSSVPPPGGARTEAAGEQANSKASRAIGLRNARANMRRDDHE